MVRPLLSLFSIVLTLIQALPAASQTTVRVDGKVRDQMGQPIPNVIVINRRTQAGSFGKADGTFSVECQRNDTLSLTSLGFYTRIITFSDSASRDVYTPVIYLEQRTYRMAEVQIFAPRDLEDIQKDIQSLGYDERDFQLSGINALASPITFLYQEFSRKEQSKRTVAMLENEDRKRELLKELFKHYVDYDIIQLSDAEFDEFISFINVSDDFLKNSSQYDFILYVKERFADYRVWKRGHGMRNTDYDYDKD